MGRAFPFRARDGRDGIVREARPGDARAILRIVGEATGEQPRTLALVAGELWSPREWRRRRIAWSARGVTLVAELDGAVVGQLTCERGSRAVTKHAAEFGITVARAARDQGVGRALLRALEVWAGEYGVSRIGLGVFPDNARALALYRSMGYAEEGVEHGGMRFPDGVEVDVIRMYKRLGGSSPASGARGYDER